MTNETPPLLLPGPHFARTRLLSCDVDGVLTDGGLYYDATGKALLRFHVADGIGLKRLRAAGVKTCFISQSATGPIDARARDLGIDFCFTGVEEKRAVIAKLAQEGGFSLAETVHIADDVNDLSLLRAVGVAVTVPNASAEVKAVAHFMTRTPGGEGAVRELCDAIIASQLPA
jgi:3-deoxy-D-manno-octulosonate 8-phosphate phosphatase (KDO 8-P phosphatase)